MAELTTRKPTRRAIAANNAALLESDGSRLIAIERLATRNGWTTDGDIPRYINGELAYAATAYTSAAVASPIRRYPSGCPPYQWPWANQYWKPGTAIKMLVKAGALLAAEIDRRLRAGEVE